MTSNISKTFLCLGTVFVFEKTILFVKFSEKVFFFSIITRCIIGWETHRTAFGEVSRPESK